MSLLEVLLGNGWMERINVLDLSLNSHSILACPFGRPARGGMKKRKCSLFWRNFAWSFFGLKNVFSFVKEASSLPWLKRENEAVSMAFTCGEATAGLWPHNGQMIFVGDHVEYPRMFRRHFAEVTFPSTLSIKQFQNQFSRIWNRFKPEGSGFFEYFTLKTSFKTGFRLSEIGLYQKVP